MSKNNRLINAMKSIAAQKSDFAYLRASNNVVPQIYAALAIALHREFGWGYTRINRAFAESQKIWEEFSGKGNEMMKICEEETGISLELGKDI